MEHSEEKFYMIHYGGGEYDCTWENTVFAKGYTAALNFANKQKQEAEKETNESYATTDIMIYILELKSDGTFGIPDSIANIDTFERIYDRYEYDDEDYDEEPDYEPESEIENSTPCDYPDSDGKSHCPYLSDDDSSATGMYFCRDHCGVGVG